MFKLMISRFLPFFGARVFLIRFSLWSRFFNFAQRLIHVEVAFLLERFNIELFFLVF